MRFLEFDKKFWKQYIISGIIASVGALIIFAKSKISLTNFIIFGLPMTWSGILVLALSFGILINWGKE